MQDTSLRVRLVPRKVTTKKIPAKRNLRKFYVPASGGMSPHWDSIHRSLESVQSGHTDPKLPDSTFPHYRWLQPPA